MWVDGIDDCVAGFLVFFFFFLLGLFLFFFFFYWFSLGFWCDWLVSIPVPMREMVADDGGCVGCVGSVREMTVLKK